ncbi:hypothetical protein B0H13DRAFT_1883053 [Mycena leptocephala]|nr:hypothetical protein B0H13DRAFT_1883053 [Mycena leptocephala]
MTGSWQPFGSRGDAGEEHSEDDICGNNDDNEVMETFSDAESFYDALRAQFKGEKAINFHGTYPMAIDALVSLRELSVKDHKKLKSGHRTWFWCSQDEVHKKKSKASQNPDICDRNNVSMTRYPCESKLSISCWAWKDNEDQLDGTIQLKHAAKHDNVQWMIPVAMVTQVQAAFPNVTAAQIHWAWVELSKPFWQFDDDQLLSMKKLLEEYTDDVDIFVPNDVLEGVEMVCWGMKKIAMPLKGKVVEIGVVTYNTNSKHLELYSIMGEQDRAGLPLWYLLLSTASSIDQGNLCWWHLRRAVHTCLASTKLSTTPYDPGHANTEFSFINVVFVHWARQMEESMKERITMPNGLCITIPARQPHAMMGENGALLVVVQSESERVPEVLPEASRAGLRVLATHLTSETTGTTVGKENEGPGTHGAAQTRTGHTIKPTRNADAADPEILARAMNARTTGVAASKAMKGR